MTQDDLRKEIRELRGQIEALRTALFDQPDRNISQIAEAVKGKRGTASRRIVRARLEDLQRQGIVVATPGSRTRTFRVANEVAEKWSQVLGVPKYRDQSPEGQTR